MSASNALGTTTPTEPSSTAWRRERLLRIGSSPAAPTATEQIPDSRLSNPESSTEHTTLNATTQASYGTLPFSRRRLFNRPSLNIHTRTRGVSLSSPTCLRNSKTTSNHTSPIHSPSFRELGFSRLSLQRPISAYDYPLLKDDEQADTDAAINGIRVWYSSFSSVDWLHDAIKDSVRFARLRRRTSVRARIHLVIDRGLGWFIVTVVGVITAFLAFLIVRSEQWLFDTKDGYCRNAWWKAKRFCCILVEHHRLPPKTSGYILEDRCPEWRTWADVFPQSKGYVGEDAVGYISYTLIAVCFILVIIRLASFKPRFLSFVG